MIAIQKHKNVLKLVLMTANTKRNSLLQERSLFHRFTHLETEIFNSF